MVEYTRNKSTEDIKAHGYKDIGIYQEGTLEMTNIIMESTVKNVYDVVLKQLTDEQPVIYRVFKRKGCIIAKSREKTPLFGR